MGRKITEDKKEDVTEKKKWLTADELAAYWEILIIKLYDFLRQGLPAFTDFDAPVVDIKNCASRPKFTMKQLREMNPIDQRVLDWCSCQETPCIEIQKHDQFIDGLYNAPENWIMVGGKPTDIPMSFDSPRTHSEMEDATNRLRNLKFKRDDILEFEKTHPVQPPCIFRVEGDHWHIVYFGNTLSPSNPIKVGYGSRSFVWVHRLISLYVEHGRPYDIESEQLENAVKGFSIPDDNNVVNVVSEEYDGDSTDFINDSRGMIEENVHIEGKAHRRKAPSESRKLKHDEEEYIKLQNQLKECEETGDTKNYDAILKRSNELFAQLEKRYKINIDNPDNDSSEKDDRLDKARKRVDRQITSALKRIKEHDEALHDHLKRCIKITGTSVSYNPYRNFEWEV
ncbi:MAG: hypothetical protein WAN11_19445 [Syntrophobacteraceae bacterium]